MVKGLQQWCKRASERRNSTEDRFRMAFTGLEQGKHSRKRNTTHQTLMVALQCGYSTRTEPSGRSQEDDVPIGVQRSVLSHGVVVERQAGCLSWGGK